MAKRTKNQMKKVETYKVIVEYGLLLEAMVKAGRYDSVDSNVTSEHFPFDARPPEEVEIRLVHLGRKATTDEVLAELDRMGLRPAILPELLALGAAHPDLQRKFWIIAFGSRWLGSDGDVKFPLIDGGDGGRCLGLGWGGPSDGRRRIAAVRK